MPAAVADKKGEYFERTIYSTFSGGKQLAGFQVKRDFIGAGTVSYTHLTLPTIPDV